MILFCIAKMCIRDRQEELRNQITVDVKEDNQIEAALKALNQ